MTINIPAFVINLRGKEADYETTKTKLNDYGFTNIQRFDAVVGKNLNISFQDKTYDPPRNVPISMEAYINMSEGRQLHRQIVGKGTIGCALSHYSLWKYLIDHPELDRLLIFEDDARPDDDYSIELLEKTINSVSQFDMISFGYSNIRGDVEDYNEYLNKFLGGEFFGLQGYLISRSGAQKLMKNMFPIEFQVDSYIGYIAKFDPEFKLYFTKDTFINQSKHVSSIQTLCIKCHVNDLDKLDEWIFLLKRMIPIIIIVYLCHRYYKKKN